MIVLGSLGILLMLLGLSVGSVHVPLPVVFAALFGGEVEGTHRLIIQEVRLPVVLTAAVAGGALAVCGLIMQTLFRNPLAGPSVLGISSGASLGVALVLLAQPLWSILPLPRDLMVVAASLTGAMSVLLLIVLADKRIGDGVTLLIIGLMVGYICSAIISVLQSASGAEALKGYVLWGMGSFAGLDRMRLIWLVVPVLVGLALSFTLIKSLNALLLGDDYALSMGVPVSIIHPIGIWTTGIMAGTVTAFCGPIAFLGLATPHVARAIVRTNDLRILLPASLLLGTVLALICDIIVRTGSIATSLPLNAVTSLLGAPVVLWVLWQGKYWTRRG